MSSKINWDSQEAIALYIVGGLVVGFLAKSAFTSKSTEAVKEEKPEAAEEDNRDVTDEISRPSDATTVDLNLGSDKDDDDEGWKIGTGGKKSRKRRKNKSRKSRPKSKRRTKK